MNYQIGIFLFGWQHKEQCLVMKDFCHQLVPGEGSSGSCLLGLDLFLPHLKHHLSLMVMLMLLSLLKGLFQYFVCSSISSYLLWYLKNIYILVEKNYWFKETKCNSSYFPLESVLFSNLGTLILGQVAFYQEVNFLIGLWYSTLLAKPNFAVESSIHLLIWADDCAYLKETILFI